MKQKFVVKLIAAGLLASSLFSTGAVSLPAGEHAYAASAPIERSIAGGMKYRGTPYEYNSNRNTTTSFDCSDFTRHIFKKGAGITLPGSASSQASYVKKNARVKTKWTSLKRGDLMFFMSYRGASAAKYVRVSKPKQSVTHVAIYLGNGKMLHTYSKASGGVRVDSIDNKHWEYRFMFGGSAL